MLYSHDTKILNMVNLKIKIIEKSTPKDAEYEINDFLDYCKKNYIPILEITDHVTCDADGYYSYTFNVKRSEEHTSELQSRFDLVCRLLLEKKKKNRKKNHD